jgi:transposase, IS6 family
VKARWCYLYRAIDSTGATIDFLLSALRDAATAKRLFRRALSDPSHPQPRVINTDKARSYASAITEMKAEGSLRRRCRHRPVQYLNNILEQDHRAIKRRVKAQPGFRAFDAARQTIAGYEVIHVIRKGQARGVSDEDVRRQNQFIDQLFSRASVRSPSCQEVHDQNQIDHEEGAGTNQRAVRRILAATWRRSLRYAICTAVSSSIAVKAKT